MIARLLAHLRQQWMGAIALFLVLTGGVAYAANTVFSTDIVNDQVYSADVRNDTLTGGGLTTADLRNGAVGNTEIADGGVRSVDVQNEALTGADIKNQSGVDSCTHGALRLGELCVRILQTANNWNGARNLCSSFGLRLPSLGEAESVTSSHDLPTVDETEKFWTEELFFNAGSQAFAVDDSGTATANPIGSSWETVCVTTPTN